MCTLTDHRLARRLATAPRVAAAAPLATANVGIEHLVLGVLAVPTIHHLVVCGRDSSVFGQGQSLVALALNGCAADGSIIGAVGFRAAVPTLKPTVITEFRQRISVHDLIGTEDCARIADSICDLPAGSRSVSTASLPPGDLLSSGPSLTRLPAGGRRAKVVYSAEGYFVVGLDRASGRLLLRYYARDLTHGYELASKSPEALMLGVINHGLLADPAHAGYLGGELAQAEIALRLGLDYRQDRPLAMAPRTDGPLGEVGVKAP